MVRIFETDYDYWSWACKQYCMKYQKIIDDIGARECSGPKCTAMSRVRARDPACKYFWGDRNGNT